MGIATREFKVGLIGCGAVAELCHVPALRRLLSPEQIWLADTNLERASLLGRALGLSDRIVADYRELIGVVDAAIVSVPNDLHAPVASALLASGIHVLCEKPLAPTVEEAETIVAAAGPGTVLCVGNVRRFFPSTRFVEHALRSGLYGRPLSFTAEEGVPFDWPTASGFLLDPKRSGGGVLIDSGAHTLDQLLLWFGSDLAIRSYEDDGLGGVEAECRIELAAGSVTGTVEMSRTRRLTNTVRIECERGTIEAPLSELAGRMTLAAAGEGGYELDVEVPDESMGAHEAELRDFFGRIEGGSGIGASGEDGLRVVRLVRDCYSRREALDEPWVARTIQRCREGDSALSSLYGKILVTGASGFLGCRLCEQLRLGHGAAVRAMIHRPERAMRLARLDVELVQGDLADPESLASAVEGCDAVVHCAIGSDDSPGDYRFLTGKAAGNMAEAAFAAGVKRFVHLSSVAVHGYNPPEEVIDEDSASRFTGDDYADAKIEAEAEIAAAVGRGLPAVVLRPTNIFGPYSTIFTVNPVEALKRGHIALVGNGAGLANTVYVDNVVHAIVLALRSGRAVGERFIVSDEDGTTWRDLYEAYARLISTNCEVRSAPMAALYPEPEAVHPERVETLDPGESPEIDGRRSRPAGVRRLAVEQPVLRVLGRAVLTPFPRAKDRLFDWLVAAPPLAPPFPPPLPPAPSPAPSIVPGFAPDEIPSKGFAEIQTSGVLFRADKARAVLGYESLVPFEVAIELTGEWLRFARLI